MSSPPGSPLDLVHPHDPLPGVPAMAVAIRRGRVGELVTEDPHNLVLALA